MRSIFLHKRFYWYFSIVVLLFLLAYWFTSIYSVAWIFLVALSVMTIVDFWILYWNKDGVGARREMAPKFSNSDQNRVFVSVKNNFPFPVDIRIIDELPFQFQKRDFEYKMNLEKFQSRDFDYSLRPVERGEYKFGRLLVFVASPLRIFVRRYRFEEKETMVKVYPSFMQMKKYQFLALSDRYYDYGLKRIRRLGHTMEFEQIKVYIPGDDVRTINWKATGKHAKLMVNEYQEEKSQPVYSLIDMGRMMKMPFEGLKLLDYAINSTLAFSSVALQKKDKVGLIGFGSKTDIFMPAVNTTTQLRNINEAIYNINTDFKDSDFNYLYSYVNRNISHRSLLLVYTNFEHKSALSRQLPYLKGIARKHLVIVIIFENTELKSLVSKRVESIQDIYHKTIAEKFSYDKRLILKELKMNGLNAILTKPEDLTVNVINKYLEFKASGRI